MTAFREECSIRLFYALLYSARANRAVIDEKEECSPLRVVVRTADPRIAFEAPAFVLGLETDKLVGYIGPMDLANAINDTSGNGNRDASRGISMLLTGEGYTGAVNGVFAYHL
jgi:hypothetical protein